MKFFFTFIALVLLCGGGKLEAASHDPEHGIDLSDSTKSKGFFGLPLLYYTPDTRWAYGVFGVYYFKLPGEQGQSTRLSYVKALADYTQNRQLDLWSSWSIFTQEEKYILKGEFRYRNFPDRFYGIGNTSSVDDVERYQYDLFSIKKLVLKKIRPHVFAGFDVQFTKFYNIKIKDEGILQQREVVGYRGGINSGIGSVFLVDNRDNVINATKGVYLELSSYLFRYGFGSDFSYTNVNLSFATYKELFPKHVLAFQAQGNFNWGNVPFTNLAQAGSDAMLRGYAANRFRDQNFAGMQAEYRAHLFWRIGVVGFAGVGDVFKSPEDVKWETLKYSYGGGLRFMVNKKERLNIRFDYGFGRDNSSFYLILTEAF